jgi:hypothetical protein
MFAASIGATLASLRANFAMLMFMLAAFIGTHPARFLADDQKCMS